MKESTCLAMSHQADKTCKKMGLAIEDYSIGSLYEAEICSIWIHQVQLMKTIHLMFMGLKLLIKLLFQK